MAQIVKKLLALGERDSENRGADGLGSVGTGRQE